MYQILFDFIPLFHHKVIGSFVGRLELFIHIKRILSILSDLSFPQKSIHHIHIHTHIISALRTSTFHKNQPFSVTCPHPRNRNSLKPLIQTPVPAPLRTLPADNKNHYQYQIRRNRRNQYSAYPLLFCIKEDIAAAEIIMDKPLVHIKQILIRKNASV